LAQCYTRLARIAVDGDRDKAAEQYELARAIYEQLATNYGSQPEYQVDWLESELAAASVADDESAEAYMARVVELDRVLPTIWPSDPDGLYRLACYLTSTEPILSVSAATKSSDSRRSRANVTSD
jgi:hypothetical protein